MIKFKTIAAESALKAASAAFPGCGVTSAELLEMFEYPPDPSVGDLALPCFKLSRSLKKAPPVIAASIAEAMDDSEYYSVAATGGYLNFKISDKYLSEIILPKVEQEGDAYGSSDVGKGKNVVLDYSSPNVSKPFHIGHLGTTVIGHSLKLIHQFAGYNCIGMNHLGDWGTQNGKQIVAFRKWGSREEVEKGGIDELVRLYVKFHEEAEKDPSLNDEAREAFTSLENGDPECIELWKLFIEISMKEYQKTYSQLGITFDSYNGESFYVDKVPAQVRKLRDIGLLKIDDGASIVDLSEYDMPPCFILKKDGSTIYHSRDIAAAVYRKETYDFEKCIYVTSAGQSLHFAQLFKVVELMGYDWYKKLIHVPYGTVSIDGSKLATRTGNVVLLRDLFAQAIDKVNAIIEEKNPDLPDKEAVAEAVGVGAVVFHYLYNSRIKDINFVMENALSFEGATGPYAQYTYARCCSILGKAGDVDPSGELMISSDEERDVLKTLARFPEKVLQALSEYEPSVITRYIIEVATSFNRFYHNCPIMTADSDEVKNSRVRIAAAVKQVLGTALGLICLKTPEKI